VLETSYLIWQVYFLFSYSVKQFSEVGTISDMNTIPHKKRVNPTISSLSESNTEKED
jgi:hypothetical protein